MRADENADQYSWSEHPWIMTSNPQKLEEYPDPSRFENNIELKDYVLKVLSNVIRLYFSNYGGLSQPRQKRMERVTRAYAMYLEDVPDKIIAEKLGCSIASVSRDRTAIEKKLRHFDKLYVDLKDRLEKNGDEIGQKVLNDILDGKCREEIICESGLKAKVVDKAWNRIRKMSREIQKEMEDKE